MEVGNSKKDGGSKEVHQSFVSTAEITTDITQRYVGTRHCDVLNLTQ